MEYLDFHKLAQGQDEILSFPDFETEHICLDMEANKKIMFFLEKEAIRKCFINFIIIEYLVACYVQQERLVHRSSCI